MTGPGERFTAKVGIEPWSASLEVDAIPRGPMRQSGTGQPAVRIWSVTYFVVSLGSREMLQRCPYALLFCFSPQALCSLQQAYGLYAFLRDLCSNHTVFLRYPGIV